MCQAEAFKCPDDITGEIELPPVEPVEGGAWEGVMIVVPALPESQHSHNPLVAAAIVRLELAFAEGVADGIDAKADMVPKENAHQPTPQQTGPATNQERDHERQGQPEDEGAVPFSRWRQYIWGSAKRSLKSQPRWA